ncbi:hypothetical protein VVD49_16270 [Uliginosibacterium sp. H3]|uniref:DUF4149 domain-containing protein n=1 Tax=Uliginosibacterium silvisoli TaxID=3114758 RepID=A0ABU6K6G7_9RHOO|nr:hypothetical protein [Uliginosibacterium sp. H3]
MPSLLQVAKAPWFSKAMLLNHAILFLCTSMYMGTGVSLVFFSFPIIPELTVDNYYLQYVPQIQAATDFFTIVTKIMLTTSVIMIVAEWKQATRWIPIVVFLAVVAAATLTVKLIFPFNAEMARHVTDPVRLQFILHEFARLSTIRFGLWSLQWLLMLWYFVRWAYLSRYPASTRG